MTGRGGEEQLAEDSSSCYPIDDLKGKKVDNTKSFQDEIIKRWNTVENWMKDSRDTTKAS